jgi:ribosome-binding factor A
MTGKSRAERVAELVREEIARLILDGLKDPRIGFVSVMQVRMSPDLKYANVYVSVYGSETEKKGSLAGLQRSAKWLRGVVARNLKLRFAPEIRFFPDDTLDRVFHLEEVFKELHEHEKEHPSDSAPDEGGGDGGAQ